MDNNIKALLMVVVGFFLIFWISQDFSLISFRNTSNVSIGLIIIAIILLVVFLNKKK